MLSARGRPARRHMALLGTQEPSPDMLVLEVASRKVARRRNGAGSAA